MCNNFFSFSSVSIGYVESQLFVTYLGGNQLRLQSAKVETCFLLFVNGEFKGGVPTAAENNDVFEMVDVGFNMIALRVVNTQQGGSGASETSETADVNTEVTKTEVVETEVAEMEEVNAEVVKMEESPVSECYLGFDSFGRPGCYDSADNRAAIFTLIPLL